MNQKPHTVACPTCSKGVLWTPEHAWRPFCSERCRLIDLGAWAAESYRVPVAGELPDPDASDPTENDRGGSPR